MLKLCFIFLLCFLSFAAPVLSQSKPYPQGYFRNPLDVPMQLVANFGELRSNHWHMGLDIRTQQRENLPVRAAAEGYIAKVKIEPGGFGRAIYINHPAGFTTLYAHLNDFAPALEQWVRAEQYKAQSWELELPLPPQLFPVAKGDLIAYSGNTGGSQGPHVHFEIRETSTDACLNPMLFGFPIPDAVPPALSRLALYDRAQSVHHQTPKLFALRKAGAGYTLSGNVINSNSDRVSFAIGATDRFTGYANPNGIYSARIFMDDVLQSQFELDGIDYDETRYLNAQTDYRYKASGGPWLQHLGRMPGDTSAVYQRTPTDGVLHLADTGTHAVRIEVNDVAGNQSVLLFNLFYKPATAKKNEAATAQKLIPQQVNIFERDDFELYTSEFAVYDTVNIAFGKKNAGFSPLYAFCNATIPVHDSVTVRIKLPEALADAAKQSLVIKSVSGSRTVVEKAKLSGDWAFAKFRQFGTYQLLVDTLPPSINAPGGGAVVDARKLRRIVFAPKDDLSKIESFRAEVDGQWLRFTNDKSRSWIYVFDEHFPAGEHRLSVTVSDVAGNETKREWTVVR